MAVRRAMSPSAWTLLIAALFTALTPGCRPTGEDRGADVSSDPIAEWRERWTPEIAPPSAQSPDAGSASDAAIAARQHLGAGDEAGAREILDQAAQAHAQDAGALARLGEAYLDLDPARGQELLRAAIERDGRNAAYRMALADSLEETGQSEAALAELQAGIEAIPDSRDLRLAYATALIRVGDAETAERVLTEPGDLWTRVPAETWERIARVEAAGTEQGLGNARRLIDQALGQIARRHRLLASAAVLQGDLARAAEEYRLSVEARRNGAAQLRLADLRVALGEETKAKEAYLGIPPQPARLARARLKRWDEVGFTAFSAEMKQFITAHPQEYTALREPPEWPPHR